MEFWDRRRRRCAEFKQLTPAYALDAVDPVETQAIERHLRGCRRCRGDVAEWREVAGQLSGTRRPLSINRRQGGAYSTTVEWGDRPRHGRCWATVRKGPNAPGTRLTHRRTILGHFQQNCAVYAPFVLEMAAIAAPPPPCAHA
jgi:hypothetical protein